jgi:adenylate kinase family enzyme
VQRILVIGPSGSGKSTLAKILGSKLGLPVIHLDQEYWLPGWVERDPAEWRRRVEELSSPKAWVMDGNYGGTLAFRLQRAEAVIWLDLPRSVYLPRTIWRMVAGFGRVRPDMAPGCPERFDLKFFTQWVWTYPTRDRPKTLALLANLTKSSRLITLRSRDAVRELIRSLPASLENGSGVAR